MPEKRTHSSNDVNLRAADLVAAMTLDEKIRLVHTRLGFPAMGKNKPEGAVGSAAFAPGIARLGIPDLQETDASLGIANPENVRPGDHATALPSTQLLAATFNPELARLYGEITGKEAHDKGFNVLLGGGLNLTREPRNGRNFEYYSEDPLLSGRMAGQAIAGTQAQGVVSTMKHFALNAQENGRVQANGLIAEKNARESELLAFEIALEEGQPGAVMPGYNLYNGEYASENAYLLNELLKGEWKFPGWVMSDWGATHSTVRAALAGLDQQSGEEIDAEVFFGDALRDAVTAELVPHSRLDDMVVRILRSLIQVGVMDVREADPVDYEAHARDALSIATEGLVLLKNDGAVLPLTSRFNRIAVIGKNADKGVLSGGGSSQVIPQGSIREASPQQNDFIRTTVWHPSSPLKHLCEKAPHVEFTYADGEDLNEAVRISEQADLVLIFGWQWMAESFDAPDLNLPGVQNALINAVTEVSPSTVVILQTGGPVAMPWLDKVSVVLAAWYPGISGGEAIADILLGISAPSGRLPVSFPAEISHLPRPQHTDPELSNALPFAEMRQDICIDYDIEGADVGYKWFERTGQKPLFPFGFGLSWTQFSHSGIEIAEQRAENVSVRVCVTNCGNQSGTDVPQIYVESHDGRFRRRLAAWHKVTLEPGETATLTFDVNARFLAEFEPDTRLWKINAGQYSIVCAQHAGAPGIRTSLTIRQSSLAAIPELQLK